MYSNLKKSGKFKFQLQERRGGQHARRRGGEEEVCGRGQAVPEAEGGALLRHGCVDCASKVLKKVAGLDSER